MTAPAPHYPTQASIDAYGKGGFGFAGLSHRGSLLCLPSGIWAWPPRHADDITDAALIPVFAAAADIDLVLIGTGLEGWAMPVPLRLRFLDLKLAVEVSRTGAAVATYNILLGEGRRVAAALIAVD